MPEKTSLLKKIAGRVILTGLLALGSSVFIKKCYHRYNPDPSYWMEHIHSLMISQEQELGVDYGGKIPKVVFYLENDGNNGLYYKKKDQINLNITEHLIHMFDADYNPDDLLNHELAHFLMDKMSEREGKGDYPPDIICNNESDAKMTALSYRIISEGIAEYVARFMTRNESDKYDDKMYPDNSFIYDGGYHLVKPILDAYGVKSIDYLMDNPPTLEEMLDLLSYQERMMKELSTREVKFDH